MYILHNKDDRIFFISPLQIQTAGETTSKMKFGTAKSIFFSHLFLNKITSLLIPANIHFQVSNHVQGPLLNLD